MQGLKDCSEKGVFLGNVLKIGTLLLTGFMALSHGKPAQMIFPVLRDILLN